MTLKEYQIEAHKTANYTADKAKEYLFYGLTAKIGELCDIRKKHLRESFSDREFVQQVIPAVGDVIWYIAEIAHYHGTTLNQANCGPLVTDIYCLTYNLNVYIMYPTLRHAENLISTVNAFAGLTVDEFYQALEFNLKQNITKIPGPQNSVILVCCKEKS